MKRTLMLAGDVNLMNVTDPQEPVRRIRDHLAQADVRFANLECCLYDRPTAHGLSDEGFYAATAAGATLRIAGFDAVGNANNVNYGADAIRSSCAELGKLAIPCTGAGPDRASAYAPVVIERNGLRWGFIQRTSVYWPTNHEAGERSPGVAVLQGHTAYQPQFYRTRPEIPPANRPGVPPVIVTWADPRSLAAFLDDLKTLRARCDILVASHHWGLYEEVLDYQVEIAHAAIDAGADVVVGHGPHYSLAQEMYKGRPVFYGLGSFAFHSGHGGRKHGNWVGELARLTFDDTRLTRVAYSLVRHDDANQTYVADLGAETEAIARIQSLCDRFGTRLVREGDELVVWSAGA